ncbi:MAG: DUF1292 domain-containing protein [Eubacteriales bacterium]|jgi:uncharacterized protein YrzB (UPF0473 family)
MAEETFDFEEEVFTLTDEEGNESDFEFIGRIELGENTYVALVPVDGDEEEYVILKVDKDENGEEYLSTIEDDEEFDKAADAFEDEFMSEIDYDAEADETEKTDDTNK